MSYTPFKMNGFSGFKSTPAKHTKKQSGFEHQHPHTEQEEEAAATRKKELSSPRLLGDAGKEIALEQELYDRIKDVDGYGPGDKSYKGPKSPGSTSTYDPNKNYFD